MVGLRWSWAHTPAACSFPGENARSWEALGEVRPGQSSISAGALRYRAWAQSWSSAALAARSAQLHLNLDLSNLQGAALGGGQLGPHLRHRDGLCSRRRGFWGWFSLPRGLLQRVTSLDTWSSQI